MKGMAHGYTIHLKKIIISRIFSTKKTSNHLANPILNTRSIGF